MKKLSLCLSGTLLLSLLAITGCDRFKHDFVPPTQVDFAQVVFTPLQTAFNSGGIQSVNNVMAFFTDDYLHNGITKTERRAWLEGIYAQIPNPTVSVTLISSEQVSANGANANWRLVLLSPMRDVLADSTFIGDTLLNQDGTWKLRGNRAACSVPDPKQTAVLEYFTFYGCPNCPPVEARLHELQLEHIGRLIYLEHHTSGPLAVPGDPTYSYYAPGAVPVTVFQGTTKVAGSSADVLAGYDPLVEGLLNVDSPMLYQNLLYTQSGQNVSGSIRLVPTQNDFTQADLYLSVVLIEKTSTFTNTVGEHLRNVARGKALVDLRTADLTQPVSFSVNAVGSTLPDDLSLVIFAQRRPAPYANNATILSGIETPLLITR